MKKDNHFTETATTFHAWLAIAKATGNPAGDLVADLQRDPELPGNISSRKTLERYLSPRACDGAIKAIPQVWKRYTRWRAP